MTEIRTANREQVSVLARLHAACFAEAWTESGFRALLASSGAFALLAADRDEDIGFVLARVAADEAEILSLGVTPVARHLGIGKRLLSDAAALCTAAGSRQLFLEVGKENGTARRFYRHMGFREVGCRRGYYSDGLEDALTLRADLPLCGMGIGAEVD
jgi:[ribosomal protein S18]-alanine N-acetyltransferase